MSEQQEAKAMIEYIVEGMTYTQADVDAAVAAALEKAAEFFRQKAENLRNGPTAPWQAEAIAQFEYASNICSHMQPDALAEHDAKVRADALRGALQAVTEAGYYCVPPYDETGNLAQQVTHSEDAIQALIGGKRDDFE